MEKYNHLDLFSGIGGFSLGLERTGFFQTVAFCEVDTFCKQILNKHWKGVPVYDDIKKLKGNEIEKEHGKINILTGGFPCQPYSVAGKQKGTDDDRYLWPEMFRIIRETKPEFVIAENVKGLINIQDGMVFETVCSNLESEGYEVQAFNIPAAGVGAPHKRERVWIVGYSEHNGSLTTKISRSFNSTSNNNKEREKQASELTRASGSEHYEIMENSRRTLRQGSKFGTENENEIREEDANQSERSSETRKTIMANSNNTGDRASQYEINENREKTNERWKEQSQFKSSGHSEVVADTSSEQSNSKHYREEQGEVSEQEQIKSRGSDSWTLREANWISEPNVGRVAHGIPERSHRLKALGNAIVPKIVEILARTLIKVKHEHQ